MDFLAKKKAYVFLNNKHATTRVHVQKIRFSSYNIWTEGHSKSYRDTITLLKKVLVNFSPNDIPPIIIISNHKLGSGSISSYSQKDDVIFFNDYYHTQSRIEEIANQNLFVSNNLEQVLRHELGHKRHWDAAKKFYHAHKSHYNNLNEAKHDLDRKVEKYILSQVDIDYTYLRKNVSLYAFYSFEYAKKEFKFNLVNEVIAEVEAMNGSKDKYLNELINEVLNYGKQHS